MSRFNWQGVFPAVTTQLHRDQSLNLPATAQHIEALLAAGVNGLVMCGSLGENQTLLPEEKRKVLMCAVEAARGRVPVIAGVAESSTAAGVQYARDAHTLGVSGFMIMPAMVYKADAREALAYFLTVGGATPLPWMLYNNPVAYPVDVTPDMFRTLVDVPNLQAVKESSHNPRRITELRLAVGDRFALFAGVDDLILESAILGIEGWVAGAGLAFPAENQALWQLLQAQQWDQARELYRWTQPLMKLDTHTKFVQYIKLAIQAAGLGAEWVREPRLTLEGAEREQVLGIIQQQFAKRPRVSHA